MKLPLLKELSKEQDKIYNLPLTNNYLITGPPGTGKTLIALFRATMYKTQDQTPIILSHSKLLSGYMGEAAKSLKIEGEIQTYHKWAYDTYWKHFNERPPLIREWVFDWQKITRNLFSKMMASQTYLLVDEGQDMPPDFYSSVSLMAKNLTIFADENQRITDTQSSFEDIRREARIKAEHEYRLTRNYRNTKQIAKVAACFYADLPNGIPDLPSREGPLPVIKNTTGLDDAIDLICRFERSFPHFQIGIFTKTVAFQRILLERLQEKTQNRVQSYNSDDGVLPSFSKPGIKLITYASAKGLEFDAVFLPELQYANMDMEEPVDKMIFYVLLSRAREYLYLLYSGIGIPALLELIPDDLVEYQ